MVYEESLCPQCKAVKAPTSEVCHTCGLYFGPPRWNYTGVWSDRTEEPCPHCGKTRDEGGGSGVETGWSQAIKLEREVLLLRDKNKHLQADLELARLALEEAVVLLDEHKFKDVWTP